MALSQESPTTPLSSPPSSGKDHEEHGEHAEGGSANVPEHMRAEEEKMRQASRKQDEARDKKFERERQKDIRGGEKVLDNKFKALEYLLSQSKASHAVCKDAARMLISRLVVLDHHVGADAETGGS